MHTPPSQTPECYYFESTAHVPNSRFPVLIYRSVLPLTLEVDVGGEAAQPAAPGTYPSSPPPSSPCRTGASHHTNDARLLADERTTISFLASHNWIHGGTFPTYPTPHYHTLTHEVYAILRGSSLTRLGVGPLDPHSCPSTEISLSRGDVIVLPAGVAHANTTPAAESGGYRYIGAYPAGSPKYDNNFCKEMGAVLEEKKRVAGRVPIPKSDPVFGKGGPLCVLWGEAEQRCRRDEG